MEKTNAMRMLDQKKIKYQVHEYPHEEGVCVDGATVASLLHEDPNMVFKTLVTVSNDKKYFVCVVPVEGELDLKKCAKAAGVKSLVLIPVKDLLPLTGYVRGGCSPIGMRKPFPTLIDLSAANYEEIIFSGGKIGTQIQMNPQDLTKLIRVSYADLRKE